MIIRTSSYDRNQKILTRKGLLAKFKFNLILHLQVMHDYMCIGTASKTTVLLKKSRIQDFMLKIALIP